MKLYRLEHRSSGLGPFQHRSSRQKSPDQTVLRYLNTDARGNMPDPLLYGSPMSKQFFIDNPGMLFAWESKALFSKMIKSPENIARLGFLLAIYDVDIALTLNAGQVVFKRANAFYCEKVKLTSI